LTGGTCKLRMEGGLDNLECSTCFTDRSNINLIIRKKLMSRRKDFHCWLVSMRHIFFLLVPFLYIYIYIYRLLIFCFVCRKIFSKTMQSFVKFKTTSESNINVFQIIFYITIKHYIYFYDTLNYDKYLFNVSRNSFHIIWIPKTTFK